MRRRRKSQYFSPIWKLLNFYHVYFFSLYCYMTILVGQTQLVNYKSQLLHQIYSGRYWRITPQWSVLTRVYCVNIYNILTCTKMSIFLAHLGYLYWEFICSSIWWLFLCCVKSWEKSLSMSYTNRRVWILYVHANWNCILWHTYQKVFQQEMATHFEMKKTEGRQPASSEA